MENEKKKGLNTNSNTYTIVYSIVIVVVVAFLLAFVSKGLEQRQNDNVALDKKKQILYALNIRNISDAEANAKYKEVVLSDDIIDVDGNITEHGNPGSESAGFRLNSADKKAGRLAIYTCNIDGATKYVIPLYGMGLWGAVYGYLAINSDGTTVYGAYFNHDGETAGLGAEIKDDVSWQERFQGKKIFADGSDEVALAVKKKVDNPQSQVDAITGATLTSDGVSNMLHDDISLYKKFFLNLNTK